MRQTYRLLLLASFSVLALPARSEAAEEPATWQLQFELIGLGQLGGTSQIEVARQAGQDQLRLGVGASRTTVSASTLGSAADLTSWGLLVAPGYRRYLASADAAVAPFADVELFLSRSASDNGPLSDGTTFTTTITTFGGKLGGGLEVRPFPHLVLSGRVFVSGAHSSSSGSPSQSSLGAFVPSLALSTGAAAGIGLVF